MRIFALLAIAAAAGCGQPEPAMESGNAALQPAGPAQPEAAAPLPNGAATTASGLRFETLAAGTGPRPQLGDPVLVTYEGRLADGTVFDSSAEPVAMVVGELIPGFNEGLLLMREGGRYRLRIPADLGYGAEGAGGGAIPPDAELDFTVTLVDVGGAAAAQPLPPPGNDEAR